MPTSRSRFRRRFALGTSQSFVRFVRSDTSLIRDFSLSLDRSPPLLDFLDSMTAPDRKVNAPFMLPISEKYNDLGTIVVGKIESGRVYRGDTLLLMPNRVRSLSFVPFLVSITSSLFISFLALPGARRSRRSLRRGLGGTRGCLLRRQHSNSTQGSQRRGCLPWIRPFECSGSRQDHHSVPGSARYSRFQGSFVSIPSPPNPLTNSLLPLSLPFQNIITAGYSAVMHIHTDAFVPSLLLLQIQR